MLNYAFETELKINSHDCDYNGVLRPSGYMRYLQECANLQVESGGFGYDDCLKKNCAFILSRVSLSVYQPLFPGDRVLCRTAPCQSKGVTFYRNSELYKNGRPVAELSSIWALVQISDKKLLTVEEAGLPFPTVPFQETDVPLRFRIPKDLAFRDFGSFYVGYSVCDRNRHMNNTRYPDLFCDKLPLEGKRLRELSVSYRTEAPLGETLSLFAAEEAGTWFLRCFRCSDGQLCAEGRLVFENL